MPLDLTVSWLLSQATLRGLHTKTQLVTLKLYCWKHVCFRGQNNSRLVSSDYYTSGYERSKHWQLGVTCTQSGRCILYITYSTESSTMRTSHLPRAKRQSAFAQRAHKQTVCTAYNTRPPREKPQLYLEERNCKRKRKIYVKPKAKS
jgi:hypothetical protein